VGKTLKEQIGDILEEYHKLRGLRYDPNFLLTYADVDIMIYELRKTLEERKDYGEVQEETGSN